MGEELDWDQKRKETEFEQAVYFLRSMGLPEAQAGIKLSDVTRNHGSTQPLGLSQTDAQLFSRAQFTPDEVANLRKQFEQFDFDQDQRITRSDLLHAMQNMGYDASIDRADGILREVDFGRKGEIDFQDYLDIAAGLKELQLESAFTHLAQMHTTRRISDGSVGPRASEDSEQRSERRKIPVERSGGGT